MREILCKARKLLLKPAFRCIFGADRRDCKKKFPNIWKSPQENYSMKNKMDKACFDNCLNSKWGIEMEGILLCRSIIVPLTSKFLPCLTMMWNPWNFDGSWQSNIAVLMQEIQSLGWGLAATGQYQKTWKVTTITSNRPWAIS